MNQDEPGWINKLRPFGTTDVAQWEARFGRCASLARALWGRTSEDLQHQLEKSHPDIPLGFNLDDFQLLLRVSSTMSSMNLHDRRTPRLSVGAQRFSDWESRAEIVRRAIKHLGGN
jgi:hypothetical protein